MITANEILNEKIKFESMSDEDFFAQEIVSWLGGKTRQEMILGREYYRGNHEILKRKRTAIGKNGDVEEVENIPNNIVIDNRFARMLDQKKNYLLGKPITIKSNDDLYYTELKNILNAKFIKNIKVAGEESLLGGISWLYVYIDDCGELKIKCFPSYEICPFWKDSSHTELDCVARVYTLEVYENKQKKIC
ncbi:MAG: phage portal protein [Clostridia bacterium]